MHSRPPYPWSRYFEQKKLSGYNSSINFNQMPNSANAQTLFLLISSFHVSRRIKPQSQYFRQLGTVFKMDLRHQYFVEVINCVTADQEARDCNIE
jgi:hypothetical protein